MDVMKSVEIIMDDGYRKIRLWPGLCVSMNLDSRHALASASPLTIIMNFSASYAALYSITGRLKRWIVIHVFYARVPKKRGMNSTGLENADCIIRIV